MFQFVHFQNVRKTFHLDGQDGSYQLKSKRTEAISWLCHCPVRLSSVLLFYNDTVFKFKKIGMPDMTVSMKKNLPLTRIHGGRGFQQIFFVFMEMMHQCIRRRIRQSIPYTETPVLSFGAVLQYFRDLFLCHAPEIYLFTIAPGRK